MKNEFMYEGMRKGSLFREIEEGKNEKWEERYNTGWWLHISDLVEKNKNVGFIKEG